MHVLSLISTPRANGNSGILADAIAEGAQASGATVETLRLGELDIRPCMACDACQDGEAEPCVIADDMPTLRRAVEKAQAFIFSSPIYFFTMSGQMKVALDRLYSLGGAGHFNALRGKPVALAFTYGAPDPLESGVMNAVRTFQDACAFLGAPVVGWVHASCAEAGSVRANTDEMRIAADLGRKLAAS